MNRRDRKRSTLVIVAVVGLMLMAGISAEAASYQTVESSSPQEVVDAMANKAVRGIANTATGWLEFPKQIYQTVKEDGMTKGIFVGPLKGVGMTLVRTVTGVAEAATFLVPFPGFYDPYFEPAYVWELE